VYIGKAEGAEAVRLRPYHTGAWRSAAAGEAMESLIGGERLVTREEVERAVKLGYSNFKNDMNLNMYINPEKSLLSCQPPRKESYQDQEDQESRKSLLYLPATQEKKLIEEHVEIN
jgi:hypothetical protein